MVLVDFYIGEMEENMKEAGKMDCHMEMEL